MDKHLNKENKKSEGEFKSYYAALMDNVANTEPFVIVAKKKGGEGKTNATRAAVTKTFPIKGTGRSPILKTRMNFKPKKSKPARLGWDSKSSSSLEKKGYVYIPPQKRPAASNQAFFDKLKTPPPPDSTIPKLSGLEASTRCLSLKEESESHKECLVERLSKEQAEALTEACLKRGSLFRDRLHEIGVSCDFDVTVTSSSPSSSATKKPEVSYGLLLDTRLPLAITQVRSLRAIFRSLNKVGFLEWLSGAKGWKFDSGSVDAKWKPSILNKLNCLQDVFKNFAPDAQKFMFPGGRKYTWRKAAELQVCVCDIRMWLETLEPSPLVKKLLRNSYTSPDTCVHWAHHHPLNKYPLTVVTKESMMELIDGIVQIFIKTFTCPENTPLGDRWLRLADKRQTEWDNAKKMDKGWTKERFAKALNGDGKLSTTLCV